MRSEWERFTRGGGDDGGVTEMESEAAGRARGG